MPTPLSQVDEEFIRTMYGWEEELTEENFYVPAEAEYEDFGEETEEVEVASLWENIRKKKRKRRQRL
jgi:ubiquinone biosynthesis protein UbiJ